MTYLAVNAGIIAVLAAALCLLAVRTGDPSFIDPCWGFGFVVLAWATLVQSDTPSWLLAALTSAWGLRLGGYLLWRWRREGPDKRYEGRSPIAVFATQAVLMLIIALPIELGQQRPVQFNALTVAGVAVVLDGNLVAGNVDHLARDTVHPVHSLLAVDQEPDRRAVAGEAVAQSRIAIKAGE